jgi:hypothetical protein
MMSTKVLDDGGNLENDMEIVSTITGHACFYDDGVFYFRLGGERVHKDNEDNEDKDNEDKEDEEDEEDEDEEDEEDEEDGIIIGNSLENNSGGLGAFIGPNHCYFLYCGEKYPEIALARFHAIKKQWYDYTQWQDEDTLVKEQDMMAHEPPFLEIWTHKKNPLWIFLVPAGTRKYVIILTLGEHARVRRTSPSSFNRNRKQLLAQYG